MNKEVGAFSVDVELQTNGKYSICLSKNDEDSVNYINQTAEQIGIILCNAIETAAERL